MHGKDSNSKYRHFALKFVKNKRFESELSTDVLLETELCCPLLVIGHNII